ncbi:SDR family oxidoreductase [Clostridia bacterium]|nr:SDR family oxidoreductase [Clostridia bacterium]
MVAKRILVAGGAGFIGSHLCERLLKSGHVVLCLDNFRTGSPENLSSLLNKEHFTLVKHDVMEPFDWDCDEIYNLACPASPVHYQKDPIDTMKTSFLGACHLLELARKQKAKILQCSTSEIYGDPDVHPQKESYYGNVNPHGIRSCYDEGKRAAETLFFDYYRKHKIQIKVIRIFNTYGTRMALNDGRVVSNFILQALRKEDITIYGDGSQTRSFCYVDDMIEAMIRMMHSDDTVTGPINLGRPEEVTMLELAHKVLAITNSPSKLVFRELPSDDPAKRCPDIGLARDILDWEPTTSLDKGLRETVSFFRNQLEGETS